MIGVGDILNHQTEEIAKLRARLAGRDAEIAMLREAIVATYTSGPVRSLGPPLPPN